MTGISPKHGQRRLLSGFTLAELLIALAILGVVATFTIPKVLVAQQNQTSKAIAKEAAATISAAYQAYKLTHTITAITGCGDLTPYMNYVKVDTSTLMDDINNSGSNQCSSTDSCLILHNGSAIMYCNNADDYFGGTASTNAIFLQLDPDARYGGSTTGPSKSVLFFLYPSGRLATIGTILPNTVTSGGSPQSAWAAGDPSWFSW